MYFLYFLLLVFSLTRENTKKKTKNMNGNTEKMKYENEIRGQNTKVEIGLR